MMKKNQLEEKTTFSCPTELPDLRIIKSQNSTRLWKYFHETYAVCTIPKQNSGGGAWSYRGKEHVVTTRGQLMLIEPGEVHQTTKAYHPCDLFYVVQIPYGVVENLAKEMGLKSAPHFKDANAFKTFIVRSFYQFHRSLENKNATLLEKQSLFHLALSSLLRECCEENAKPLLDPP